MTEENKKPVSNDAKAMKAFESNKKSAGYVGKTGSGIAQIIWVLLLLSIIVIALFGYLVVGGLVLGLFFLGR